MRRLRLIISGGVFERALVLLDGSELAEVALPYTELPSGKLDSEVVLICIREVVKEKTSRIAGPDDRQHKTARKRRVTKCRSIL